MNKYPKGSLVRKPSGDFCLILEELGDIRFLSESWSKDETLKSIEKKKKKNGWDAQTIHEMEEDGYEEMKAQSS